MDSNELKAACEMAGLEVKTSPGFADSVWCVYVEHDRMWNSNPALKPYAAELLTAKVRERSKGWVYYLKLVAQIDPHREDACDRYALATAEQRIRAAVSVLKGGGK